MNINNIIRAWKDEDYRLSLTAAERATLPENPAGIVELSDTQLESVNGAFKMPTSLLSICACPSYDMTCPPPTHEPKVPPTKRA